MLILLVVLQFFWALGFIILWRSKCSHDMSGHLRPSGATVRHCERCGAARVYPPPESL